MELREDFYCNIIDIYVINKLGLRAASTRGGARGASTSGKAGASSAQGWSLGLAPRGGARGGARGASTQGWNQGG